jgi:hypothetical protein
LYVSKVLKKYFVEARNIQQQRQVTKIRNKHCCEYDENNYAYPLGRQSYESMEWILVLNSGTKYSL